MREQCASMSSEGPEWIEPLMERLQSELRRTAWEIVAEVVEGERRRRQLVLDSVENAFATVLAKPLVTVMQTAPTPSSPLADEPEPTPAAPPAVQELRLLGVVKWFNETKGFGFIVDPDGRDVFVHYKHVAGDGCRSLDEGMRVSYVAQTGPRGPYATDVRPAHGD
jgi:CspA family cold shock protein